MLWSQSCDRLVLQRKVERAFFEAGKALAELRDRRLYRSTHKTFEEYCKAKTLTTTELANFCNYWAFLRKLMSLPDNLVDTTLSNYQEDFLMNFCKELAGSA